MSLTAPQENMLRRLAGLPLKDVNLGKMLTKTLSYTAVAIWPGTYMIMMFFGWAHRHVADGIHAISYVEALEWSLWSCGFALLLGVGKGFAQVIESSSSPNDPAWLTKS